MKIIRVEPFLLHVPVTGQRIADSMHQVTHWGVPGVILHTDSGLAGFGYTGTHAHLATDRLITDAIEHTYGPLLAGEEANDIQRLWRKLHGFPPALWVGRAGVLKLALAAVDVDWHLALAHPACTILEYIPWLRECFEEPALIQEGRALAPVMHGAGTTLRADDRERFGVPLPASAP